LARRSSEGSTASRIRVVLCCSVCGGRNYRTTKAARETAGALSFKKFCKVCNAHTTHTESK
jgi:large subunit ribosomal protein L33